MYVSLLGVGVRLPSLPKILVKHAMKPLTCMSVRANPFIMMVLHTIGVCAERVLHKSCLDHPKQLRRTRSPPNPPGGAGAGRWGTAQQ